MKCSKPSLATSFFSEQQGLDVHNKACVLLSYTLLMSSETSSLLLVPNLHD